MSDLDDDFMQMSEDEDDFSFEYEEDDEVMDEDFNDGSLNQDSQTSTSKQEHHHDLESLYYTAKASKEEDITKSIEQFNYIINLNIDEVVKKESDLEYIFKSIKQVLKLYYHLNQFDQLMDHLPLLFFILPKLSNTSYGEESINRLVNHYDKPKTFNTDTSFLSSFLDNVIKGVIASYKQENLPNSRLIPQDRLWLNLNLKKTNLLIRNNAKQDAINLLTSLQEICENSTESIKGSYMLEIIALQIKLYSEIPESFSILKELYNKSFQINSAVPHPKIMGVIKECGGEIFMKQSNYHKASNEFYESFKNYDELGDDKRILMLKRLMISNMLSESEINPFHAKEFQSFVKLEEIQIFLKLYDSFINIDIKRFNELIEQNTNNNTGLIFGDLFLTTYIEELKSIIQIQTIIGMTKHYSKLEFSYLAEILHCDYSTIQLHILKLISSGKLVNLKMDFVNNVVEITENETKVMGNIDVDDIIKKLKLSDEKEVDNDGDHVMNEQQQQQQQHSKGLENDIIRERRDYIKLTYNMVQTLNLFLGNINNLKIDSNDQSKTYTIYNVKLQSMLQDWLNIISTSLPVKTAEKLSQVEQVKLEQQQQQQQLQDDNNNNEVEQETAMGELALDINTKMIEENGQEIVTTVTRNDSIRYLIKSITSYQEKLVNHYDDKSTFAKNLLQRYEEQ